MGNAVDAANATIDTLGIGDKFAVITFGSNTRILGGHNSLIEATQSNKQSIK